MITILTLILYHVKQWIRAPLL